MALETGLAELVRLTAHVCETTSAALTLHEGQRLVLEASHGLGAGDVASTLAACERAARGPGAVVVRDLAEEAERPAADGLQPAAQRLRFFAAQPLLGERQERLGVLAVLDPAPRALVPRQREALQLLA